MSYAAVCLYLCVIMYLFFKRYLYVFGYQVSTTVRSKIYSFNLMSHDLFSAAVLYDIHCVRFGLHNIIIFTELGSHVEDDVSWQDAFIVLYK